MELSDYISSLLPKSIELESGSKELTYSGPKESVSGSTEAFKAVVHCDLLSREEIDKWKSAFELGSNSQYIYLDSIPNPQRLACSVSFACKHTSRHHKEATAQKHVSRDCPSV
jgi:hypothetical protein